MIKPKIWIRYVDDTFVIVKKEELENTYKQINNVFNDIKFTMEQESDNKLPFLDVLITRTDTGKLETQVHRKPTHTDQILNYNSNNPRTHKINCVQTLFKRARTHCNTITARKNEEKHLKTILQKNGYPISFIKKYQSHTPSETNSGTKINKRITLPYIKGISETTTRLLKTFGIGVAHKPTKSLHSILCKPKDEMAKEDKTNIIYKINCTNCNKHYIGQSGRPLHLRLHEHQLAVKRHDISSLISIHVDNCGHTFNWENVQILDRGNSKNTREFLEAWHSGQSAINKHIEINPIYQPIKKIMQKHRNKNQTNGRYNQNKEINNDRFKVNKNQSTSRCTGQAVNHMWRNSNTSLLPEVCADDVVQKDDESSTTKPSSSENKPTSKSPT